MEKNTMNQNHKQTVETNKNQKENPKEKNNNSASKQEESKESKKKRIIKEIISDVFLLLLAIVIAIVWKKYIATHVEVISGSMKDTLQVDDKLTASRLPYLFGSPKRGDIVVFHFPDDEEQIYIKRLIGLPGETIEIIGGYVYVDGVLLEEDYVKGERRGNYGPYEVPEGEYFMLGDNRLHSGDSREWNDKYVSMKQIIGKAMWRFKPKFQKFY